MSKKMVDNKNVDLQGQQSYDDEIDLVELLTELTKKWKLITFFILLSLVIAGGYLALTPSTFQVSAKVSTGPSSTPIVVRLPNFTRASLISTEAATLGTVNNNHETIFNLSPKKAANLLADEIVSSSVRQAFLAEEESAVLGEVSTDVIKEETVSVSMDFQQSINGERALKSYLPFALNSFREKIKNARNQVIQEKIDELKVELVVFGREATATTQLSIDLVEEAFELAEKMGLHEPNAKIGSMVQGENKLLPSGRGDNVLRLLPFGTNALSDVLTSLREQNIRSSRELELQAAIKFLEQVAETDISKKLFIKNISEAKKTKPKPILVLVLALVLGVMVGVFVALLKNALEKRKRNQLLQG
ncbi:hypothetical protein LG288_02585 [Idiomarina seosinensis]|uniref:Wzz/FepE/Etk N-terminal domain-containing protein n=1 Tax=Idiomarina seosinensis TaxID=281739 RepID=UPI00384F0F22